MDPAVPPAHSADAASVEGSGEPVPTSADVASALARLNGLSDVPLDGHPDVYQGVHGDLQRALADIDGG
ncbi:MAG: hypothetical protein ABI345_09805 [Jatrophihabitans sp.]